MDWDYSVIFEVTPKSCILDSFVDYEGYSISSKGFLPTIVDAMSCELNSSIPIHFSSLIPKMLMFTLAISCLTTSNLPRFQAPMYYHSLQHQTLPSAPDTSTPGHYFCFYSASSFFLELFLCSSPVAYLGGSSSGVISFCLFILFMGFSKQEYWSNLPFPSPVDHVLSELSTMTCPSWVALHVMAHSFIELDKTVVPVINLISFLWLWFSLCLFSDG